MKQALLPPGLDETDDAAIAEFRGRYGHLELTPVVVVIAAYEEEAAIGAVLDELPAEVCDLATSCIVVVDGDTDRTSSVARTTARMSVRSRLIAARARRSASATPSPEARAHISSPPRMPTGSTSEARSINSCNPWSPARPTSWSAPDGWAARRRPTGSAGRAHVSSGVSPPSSRGGASPTRRPASVP